VAIDPQGRIVVAGDSFNGSNSDFAVARYNANGSLDPSFGPAHDGKATTDFHTDTDEASSVAIDAQGRIVVAGTDRQGDNDFAVARYNDNGTPDTNFGPDHNGKVTVDFTPGANDDDLGTAVAIDAQGRIVLAGTSNSGGTDDFALARLNSDGSRDATFGTRAAPEQGEVTTPIGSGDDFANGVAIDSQDRIVAAGESNGGGTAGFDFALVRYTPGGALDTSFNGNGKVTTPFGTSSDEADAVTVDPQGRIVAAGRAGFGFASDFALVRYTPGGVLDTSFNGSGKVTTPIGANSDIARAVAIDPQGRVVVAGEGFEGLNDFDFALARYTAAGTLDPSFNGSGKATTDFGTGSDGAHAVAIDPAGRIVAAGSSNHGSNIDFALARYIGDAVPPTVTIGSGPANGGFTNDPTPTFQFSSSEAGSTFACGFEGLSAPCSSPFTPPALADGSHSFSLTGTDKAGNASAAQSRRFTVDTRKPELKIKGKAKVKTAGRKGRDKLKLKANEPSTFTCRVDRKKAKPCKAKYKTPKLKLGNHKLKVTATDRAGNKVSKVKKLKVVRKR
jgi:uncharacterized delta-60 repeat protein